jgi:hypothetical protein
VLRVLRQAVVTSMMDLPVPAPPSCELEVVARRSVHSAMLEVRLKSY